MHPKSRAGTGGSAKSGGKQQQQEKQKQKKHSTTPPKPQQQPQRNITYKPGGSAAGGTNPLHRSLYQGNDLLSKQQQVNAKDRLNNKGALVGSDDHHNHQQQAFGRRPPGGALSPEETQEIKDIVALFSPELVDRYPMLKVVSNYAQHGEWELAKQSLATLTKSMEIELGEDAANKAIFDPTKHNTYGDAMAEFIYKDPAQDLSGTDAIRLQVDATAEQFFGSAKTDKKNKFLLEQGDAQQRHKQQFEREQQQQHYQKQQFQQQQQKQHEQEQQQQPNQHHKQRQPKYAPSPPLPNKMPQTPAQWDKLVNRHRDSFEDFTNPTFLDPLRNKKVADTKDYVQSLESIYKSGQNPFYLPDGSLNVRWIRANGHILRDEHSELIKPTDIDQVLYLLTHPEEHSEAHPGQQQQQGGKMDPREMLKQFEVNPTGMGRRVKQYQLEREEDPAERRALDAFGGVAAQTNLIPTTSQLVSSTSGRSLTPEAERRYAIDKTKLDMEVGFPFLKQLRSISTLPPAEREKLAANPHYGSLSLLTPYDIDTIEKEYDFTNPTDVAAYITRFLGRSAEEVDHRYNIGRKEHERMLKEFQKEQAKNADLKNLNAWKKQFDAALDGEFGYFGQAEEQTDAEMEEHLIEKHGGVEGMMKAKLKHVFTKDDPYSETAAGLRALGEKPGKIANPEQHENMIALLNKLGTSQQNEMVLDFEKWQNDIKDPRQRARGLTGILAGSIDTIGGDDEELQQAAFGRAESPQDDERVKAMRQNMQKRREFEDRLPDYALAQLRASQIASKNGKEKDLAWIAEKSAKIYQTLQQLKKRGEMQQYQLLRASPEERSQNVLAKTLKKYRLLYDKYLPKPEIDEHEALLEQEREQMNRGDDALHELDAQRKGMVEAIAERENARSEVNNVLKARHEALLRRSREIQIIERRMELQAKGLTPQEIAQIEQDDEMQRQARGVNSEDIIKKRLDDEFENPLRRTPEQVQQLLELESKKQLQFNQSPEVIQQNDKHRIESHTKEYLEAQAKQGEAQQLLEHRQQQEADHKAQQDASILAAQQKESLKSTKPSLLDRVRKRKIVKEFEDKQNTGEVVIDDKGMIQLSQEHFQKQVAKEQAKRQLDYVKQVHEVSHKVSEEVMGLLQQEEEERNQKLQAIREMQDKQEAAQIMIKKTRVKPLFPTAKIGGKDNDNDDDKDDGDDADNEGFDAMKAMTPEEQEVVRREEAYRNFNKRITELSATTPEEEAVMNQLFDEPLPLYTRPKPILTIPEDLRIAFASSDDDEINPPREKLPDHMTTVREFNREANSWIASQHDLVKEKTQNKLLQRLQQQKEQQERQQKAEQQKAEQKKAEQEQQQKEQEQQQRQQNELEIKQQQERIAQEQEQQRQKQQEAEQQQKQKQQEEQQKQEQEEQQKQQEALVKKFAEEEEKLRKQQQKEVLAKPTNPKKQYASALDAFFDANDDFDNLFKDDQKQKDGTTGAASDAAKQTDKTNDDNQDFIDIEGAAEKKGLIEDLAESVAAQVENAPRRLPLVGKSDTSLLSKLAPNNNNNTTPQQQQIDTTAPMLTEAIVESPEDAEARKQLDEQIAQTSLKKVGAVDEEAAQPALHSINKLSALTTDLQKKRAAEQELLQQQQQVQQQMKNKTTSIFDKLQETHEKFVSFEQQKTQALEQQQPVKKSLGLAALQEKHLEDASAIERRKLDQDRDEFLAKHNISRKKPLKEMAEAISAARTTQTEMVEFVNRFRMALGLEADETLHHRDPFHNITMLDEDLLDDFYQSLASNAAASGTGAMEDKKTKKRVALHEALSQLRTQDEAGFKVMMSMLYFNGGKEMVKVTHCLRSVQEMVLSGQVKDVQTFMDALNNSGLDKNTIARLEPGKLFGDLEAERLGLDDGGALVDDAGDSPVVVDPLDDYVQNAERPLYSSKTTDLKLVAAMKRKERSTVFQDLDKLVDDDMTREVTQGKGLFKLLTEPRIENPSPSLFQLNDPDGAENMTGLYNSTSAYDPNDPNSGRFDSFFDEPGAKTPTPVTPAPRRSVLAGLMQGNKKGMGLEKMTAHQSSIRLHAPQDHDSMTTEQLASLDEGIRQRLQLLVDRISRHTLLSPSLVLQRMEDPKQFAQLLSLLTPELVQEMGLVDKLLDVDRTTEEKRLLYEMGDVSNPRQLTDKQTHELLPDFQGDLAEFKDEFHNVQRTLQFVEDKDRSYLKGYLDPGYLKLDDPNRPVNTPEDIAAGRDPAGDYDRAQRAKRISGRRHMQDVTLLEATEANIDQIVGTETKQKSLLETIQDSMKAKDEKLKGALMISVSDTAHGPGTRRLLTDHVLNKKHVLSSKRKVQLTRMSVEQAEKLVEHQKRVKIEFLQRLEDIRSIMIRGELPFVENGQLVGMTTTKLKEIGLLPATFNRPGENSAIPQLPALVQQYNAKNEKNNALALITNYDMVFAEKELDKFFAEGSGAVSELLSLFFNPSTTQDDLTELSTRGANTSVGRMYNMFSAILPRLPQQSEGELALAKFFQREGSYEESMKWLEKLRENQELDDDGMGDSIVNDNNEIGALLRQRMEEIDLASLSPEIRKKVNESKKELGMVFDDYRKIEIMYDRQLRLVNLEKERDKLGLPNFNQLNLLKYKFEVILSSLQNPAVDKKKRQQLMEDAREVMAQMIAIRNLKENDPELYYWNMFLAKIPPEYHKHAVNCHNMPIDPMRLFDDLNPGGQLTTQEALGNVLRFIAENEKDTSRLVSHIEMRATNHHPGSPTMTMRDLRKEQLVCKRILSMGKTLKRMKMDAKQFIKKELSDQYIHELRVLRMKELMDEPDVAETQRAKLEFWLDQSHQRGKKAGLTNVLIQDVQDNMDLPVGALAGNPMQIIAHKKMLKRSRGMVDPVLFNNKTARMFSHDKLNPMTQYNKVLGLRRERKKKARLQQQMENDLHPTEIAAINAAREGNRLLAYLGTHGVGSNNINADIQDLLKRQQHLLNEQKKVLLLEHTPSKDGDDEEEEQDTDDDKAENDQDDRAEQGSDDEEEESGQVPQYDENGEEIVSQKKKKSTKSKKHKQHKAPLIDTPEPETQKKKRQRDDMTLNMLGLDSADKIDKAWANLPAVHQEQKRVIDKQLATINFQLSQLVTRKAEFEAQEHVRHDGKDSSLVHVANQPFVYGRVVAAYGQTVVVEQCGSNAYMKHSQYFVQDELEQVRRAAGDAELQLSNLDNLDAQEPEFDEEGNPINLLVTQDGAEKLKKQRAAIRGNRRRWHCHKSRHMDLLCGDYVFIDPAPGRAWNSTGVESTAQTTVNSMNSTGSDDHGVVKAVFNRMNQVSKSSRSQNKLNHLEEANPICANTDHLVILCAAEGQPAFSTSLLDRYLAAAEFSGIKATIVYNKIDLIQMVDEAEKILNDLKARRGTIHEKEKTLRKKLGKKGFRHMKRKMLKEQKKQLRDTHFYTNTMQRYFNKLLYSEALAKELDAMAAEEEAEDAEDEQRQIDNTTLEDIYEEDEHGRLTYKPAAPQKEKKNKKHKLITKNTITTSLTTTNNKTVDLSVPVLVQRANDPQQHAIDYYYNDEEYDDDEEERVLLEQQLEKWITKKKRQTSREVEDKLREYERLGIKVIRVSSKTGTGMEELEALLSRFHTTSFIGQSGVGKSTILNHIVPNLDLQTSNVSVEGNGTHTTTSSRMFHLPSGGSVIDTPGSQSFVPPAVEPEFVQELFPEIKALAKFCKLSGKCNHTSEVGCAVREAVGDGSNRAYIPVTITELFDPNMMSNLRVAEFRQRLESGELRELAMNRPGNDPVLLYAQRYYQDLDAGKITSPYKDVYIPTETGFDLGGGMELDEQGEMAYTARQDAQLLKSKDVEALERNPLHVIPMEESDFENDGSEQPYFIRKDKHNVRELRELIVFKQDQMGPDCDISEELLEIDVLNKRINKQLKQWRNQRLRQRGLPVYEDPTSEEGQDGDEENAELTVEQQNELLAKEKKAHLDRQVKAGKFDFDYAYNIEAMKQQVLDDQRSQLVLDAEHIGSLHPDPEHYRLEVENDALETAKAMARIDLKDRYEEFQKAHHAHQEHQVLEFRAQRLGISVERLMELQEKVKAKKAQTTTQEQEQQQQTPPPPKQQQEQQQTNINTPNENNTETADHHYDHGEYIAPTMRALRTHNTMTESVLIDEHGAEYKVGPDGLPLEKPRAQQTPLERAKAAEAKYKASFNTPLTPEEQRHQFALLQDGGDDFFDGQHHNPAAQTMAQEILGQIEDRAVKFEQEVEDARKSQYHKSRDKLTQRRFGSKLPADSNAYIPEFRYKSYLAMVELMTKTKEHLSRRKKKSLTRKEEEQIKWREDKQRLSDQREVRRRRLLIETDPYATGVDKFQKQLELQGRNGGQIMPLSDETNQWLDEKLQVKLGQIEDPRVRARVRLLEEAKSNTMSTKKRGIEQYKDEVNYMLTAHANTDEKQEQFNFQHNMMTQMSRIYDERRELQKQDAAGGQDNTHAEHWRRTGHLKQTWSELQELNERNAVMHDLSQKVKLANQTSVTARHTDTRALTYHRAFSDDEEDNFKRANEYHEDPNVLYIKDRFETPQSRLENERDTDEFKQVWRSGPRM